MRKILTSLTMLFLANAVEAQIPVDSLQLNYTFNSNSNDLSGNNFHGILNGPTITTDRFLNVNNSYSFNGLSDFISVPDTAKIKPDFPFSISLWVKVDAFSSLSSVIYASDETLGTYSGFWVGYLPTGEVSAGYGDGLGQGAGHRITKHSGTTIDTSNWHNIIAVYNELNDIDLFIDCQEYAGSYSGSASNMVNLGANGVVGRNFGHHSNSYHNGKIDDIRIYNKSLNTLGVESLCNESNPTLGITESINSSSSKIFPNPTDGLININIENYPSAYLVRILNSNGQKMIEKEFDIKSGLIDLKDLSSGIYFVHMVDMDGVLIESKKVILK